MPQIPLPIRLFFALLLTLAAAGEKPMVGFLSGYDQLPTDATIVHRQELDQIPQDLSDYDALIAVLDCSLIGESGNLYTEVAVLRVIVFDCAGQADGGYDWMVEGGYVAELDWYSRQKYPELMGSKAILIVGQPQTYEVLP